MGIMRLNAVYETRTAAYRRREMNGLGHLVHVRTIFEARVGKRINAVRTLHRDRNGKAD